jgi:hypothetical protein
MCSDWRLIQGNVIFQLVSPTVEHRKPLTRLATLKGHRIVLARFLHPLPHRTSVAHHSIGNRRKTRLVQCPRTRETRGQDRAAKTPRKGNIPTEEGHQGLFRQMLLRQHITMAIIIIKSQANRLG